MELPACKTDAPGYVSPEDYLRLEREGEHKHEYYAGEIRAMVRSQVGPQPALT
jgi:hypothetical protein